MNDHKPIELTDEQFDEILKEADLASDGQQ